MAGQARPLGVSWRWSRTRLLTVGAILLWGLLSLGVPLLVQAFNFIRIAGFPLGYYLAAQGIPVLLVIAMFMFCRWQSKIDAHDDGRGQS